MTSTQHTPVSQPDPAAAGEMTAGVAASSRGTSARATKRRRRPWSSPWDAKRVIVNVSRVLLPVAVLATWEFASGNPDDGALVDSFYISKPSEIWEALTGWWDEGILIESLQATVTAMLYGFLLGAAGGIVVGIILGSSPTLSAIFRPFLVSLNSIPRLALVPLFILWFGFGLSMKVALVALIVFFLVFYATYEGVRDVEQRLLDVLKVMNANKLTLQMKVRVPSAMAWIIQGLQVSIPYALVAAVTAEIIGSNTGVGYLIQRSAGTFYTAGVFAGIVVLVVVAIVINALVTLVERRLLRWKPRNLTSAR